jgi:hypothetical protein
VEKMSATAINKLYSLVKKNQFRLARNLATEIETSPTNTLKRDSGFWYVYGITVRQTDRDPAVLNYIRMQMRNCENYCALMDGDWLRDDILEAIKRHDLNKAEQLIPELALLYKTDTYRLITTSVISGKIAYKRGSYIAAIKIFQKAEERFCNAGVLASDEWYMRCHFYCLKAQVASNINDGPRHQSAAFLIYGSKSKLRKFRTRLVNFGRLGNAIDDQLMRHIKLA